MRIYHLDETGLLIGEGVADESPLEPGKFLFPARSVIHEPPVVPAGQRARWNGALWVLEDLPPPPVEPSPPSAEDLRAAEIRGRLYAIDAESVRPLRAVAAGTVTAFDTGKLATLDVEAANLRAELAALVL